MFYIQSVSYSVLINGMLHGFIQPSRGIRQGDPLSPFIFILCAEALVHVMNKVQGEGRIIGIELMKRCPSVHHLLFIDNSLFLCRAPFKEMLQGMRSISRNHQLLLVRRLILLIVVSWAYIWALRVKVGLELIWDC